MKVLVTGGSGFIGSRLVADLLSAGHEVKILDKVRSVMYPELCQVGDIRDPAAVDAAVAGMDIVYHLAAEHQDDVRPVSLYYEVNVEGSARLAAACSAHAVSRLIFTSSVAVYGLNAGVPSETTEPAPFNHYGKSKLQAEDVLRRWGCEQDARGLTIVRPTVIFGEGNRGNVYNLVRQIVSDRFVMVGGGSNRKSMAYVGNIAAFLSHIAPAIPPGVSVYNYGDKPDLTMNELVGLVRSSVGRAASPLLRLPFVVGLAGGAYLDAVSALTGKKFPVSRVRVRKFCADTTVSVARLKGTGFSPRFTLQEGIERFLAHEFPDKYRTPVPGEGVPATTSACSRRW